jgi:hypothetical protein
MSFRANTIGPVIELAEQALRDIPCYAAKLPCFSKSRELMSNLLKCHAISRSGRSIKGKTGTILLIPC